MVGLKALLCGLQAVVLSIYCLLGPLLKAETGSFVHLEPGRVNCLYQDDRGYLWFGSDRGLFRYDGSSMVELDCREPGIVRAVLGIDSDLWVILDNGRVFSVVGNRLVFRFGVPSPGVNLLLEHEGSPMVLGGTGLTRFSQQPQAIALPGLKGSFQDGDTVYLATDLGVKQLSLRDGDAFLKDLGRDLTELAVSSLLKDQSGLWWLGTGSGLRCFDPKTKRLLPAMPGLTPLDGLIINVIEEDDEGSLWLGTRDGLFHYQPQVDQLRAFSTTDQRGSLPKMKIRDLLFDREGNLWVAGDGGLYVSSRAGRCLARQTFSREVGGPSPVLCLYQDHHRGLWAGGDWGLVEVSQAGAPPKDMGLAPRRVYALAGDEEHLYVGTDRGLRLLSWEDQKWSSPQPPVSGPVSALLSLNGGDLLLGTQAGPRLWANGRAIPALKGEQTGPVGVFLQGRKAVWLGAHKGLFTLKGEHVVFELDTGAPISGLTETVDDVLWIAAGEKLISWDGKGTGRDLLKTVPRLSSFPVMSMVGDHGRGLWLGTSGGLCYYDVFSGVLNTWGSREGIYEFSPAALLGGRGRVFMGGLSGVTSFDPQRLLKQRDHPPVVIRSVSDVGETSKPPSEDGLAMDPPHVLAFALMQPHLLHPFRRYACILDGHDQAWRETDSDRVYYRDVAEGTYRFRVKAQFEDGTWGEETALPLVIRPAAKKAWYRRPLPLLGLTACLLLTLFGYFRKVFAGRTSPPQAIEGSENHLPDADLASGRQEGPYRILVVDDDPINRQVLLNHLDGEYEPIAVSGGQEALDQIGEAPFDLVLLDIMMPGLSGFDVCRLIRERLSLDELPIVFLTARVGEDAIARGFQAGANDYLTKPVPAVELHARVRMHLKLGHAHQLLKKEREFLAAEVEVERLQRLNRESEILLLHSQMKPHFLQNTLNTISWLCVSDTDRAISMLEKLSLLLRKSFDAGTKRWWPLKEELVVIRDFLHIQQARFGDRLKVQVRCEEDLQQTRLPCFLIQPLVENAVFYGLQDEGGTIEVDLRKNLNQLEVCVSNEGQPLDRPFADLLDQGHAMGNIHHRLGLVYGAALNHDYRDGRHYFSFIIDREHPKIAETISGEGPG